MKAERARPTTRLTYRCALAGNRRSPTRSVISPREPFAPARAALGYGGADIDCVTLAASSANAARCRHRTMRRGPGSAGQVNASGVEVRVQDLTYAEDFVPKFEPHLPIERSNMLAPDGPAPD